MATWVKDNEAWATTQYDPKTQTVIKEKSDSDGYKKTTRPMTDAEKAFHCKDQ